MQHTLLKNWKITFLVTHLVIFDNVAKVSIGVAEVDPGIFFALAVFVRVSVAQVPLEVGVGDGVAANGTTTARVFELFSCENTKFRNENLITNLIIRGHIIHT